MPSHATIRTNGVDLHVAAEGPLGGPLVIFLHGFPEFWYGWRAQIPFFAEHGFRVLAPDQRGYGRSEKPKGIAAYDIDVLARDVIGLIDAAGRDRAMVVGHDWGGGVAWWLGMHYAHRLERLVVLNCPHPSAMLRALRTDRRQLRKSWYMLLFQIPFLPEAAFFGKDGRRLAEALVRTARPGTFNDEDFVIYREAWRQPGAARAMIDWYRAAFRRSGFRGQSLEGRGKSEPAAGDPTGRRSPRLVETPTLLIWGGRDAFFVPDLAEASIARCEHGRVEVLPESTHWVQHDAADRVNALALSFLSDREPLGRSPGQPR